MFSKPCPSTGCFLGSSQTGQWMVMPQFLFRGDFESFSGLISSFWIFEHPVLPLLYPLIWWTMMTHHHMFHPHGLPSGLRFTGQLKQFSANCMSSGSWGFFWRLSFTSMTPFPGVQRMFSDSVSGLFLQLCVVGDVEMGKGLQYNKLWHHCHQLHPLFSGQLTFTGATFLCSCGLCSSNLSCLGLLLFSFLSLVSSCVCFFLLYLLFLLWPSYLYPWWPWLWSSAYHHPSIREQKYWTDAGALRIPPAKWWSLGPLLVEPEVGYHSFCYHSQKQITVTLALTPEQAPTLYPRQK